ncbi:hypothetical protein LXL04_032209 [Taraxacum kok-saghyz]
MMTMAVFSPAISVSPSYTYYPITPLLLPPSPSVEYHPRSTSVQLKCLGFHNGFDVDQCNHNSKMRWDEFYERHQNKFTASILGEFHSIIQQTNLMNFSRIGIYLEKDWGQYFCNDDTIILEVDSSFPVKVYIQILKSIPDRLTSVHPVGTDVPVSLTCHKPKVSYRRTRAMAVFPPAISVSPSYTYYPITPLLPSTISVRQIHSSSFQLKCFGLHGGFDVDRYNQNSKMHWDEFYERHQNKFFKDRHYLEKDWGQYFCNDNTIILEAGCGAGNSAFPLMKKYPQLYVHACDFSHHAINLVKSHEKFSEDQMNAFVCNITEDDLCDHIKPASLDIATLIFTLSAVCPEKMPTVIQNLRRVLKPNGHVLLRDYAIGDYAQTMLMSKNQVISENFYFRGDGTSSFYFSEDFLSEMFVKSGFTVVDVNTYTREITNRSRNVTMERRWIRAVFRRC